MRVNLVRNALESSVGKLRLHTGLGRGTLSVQQRLDSIGCPGPPLIHRRNYWHQVERLLYIRGRF